MLEEIKTLISLYGLGVRSNILDVFYRFSASNSISICKRAGDTHLVLETYKTRTCLKLEG